MPNLNKILFKIGQPQEMPMASQILERDRGFWLASRAASNASTSGILQSNHGNDKVLANACNIIVGAQS